MGFPLHRLANLRPYSYHLTAEQNVARIRRTGYLEAASTLFDIAGRPDLHRTRRPASIDLQLGDEIVNVRDQAPLKRGNVSVTEEWTPDDVVELLNQRVFFWPGSERGPIAAGRRHFERYSGDPVVIIRVSTAELFSSNVPAEPDLCRFNSGAPRWVNGVRPRRDMTTFVPAASATFCAGAVQEITYKVRAILPSTATVWDRLSGLASPLF